MNMKQINILACVVTLNLSIVAMAQNGRNINRITDAKNKESVTTHPASAYAIAENEGGIDFRIVVYDAKEKIPIGLARVVLQRGKKIIAQDAANTAGQVWFRDIQPG